MGKNLERNEMSSVGGNNNGGSITEYERRRLANVERNKRRLEALSIPRLETVVQQCRPKKISKKTCATSTAPTEPHNLRPRPQRNIAQLQEELQAVIQADEDFLAEYADNQNNNSGKKRKGRGITRKDDIFSRTPNMPKIKVLLNDRGQPVGKEGRKLSSVVGCQVRKHLSVGCHDWREVDEEKKYDLWTDIKKIYDLDDAAFDWFFRTVGRKWKEFKAKLKELYFKPTVEYTDEEVSHSQDARVNDADWKFLFTYWMSAESKARSEMAKANRAKLRVPHTSGSLSYACSEHDLALKLGRPPRRDENFIKTHTRKNGVPTRQAEPIINQLKEVVEARPELKNRTVQEGDAFAAVCGEKEPKGYVRVWGLGPTPQDVGTPGLKGYMPTRLQMEILARKKVESEKVALQKKVDQLQACLDMREERAQQDRTSAEPMSQNGSTLRLHVNARLDQNFDGPLEQDEGEEDYGSEDNGCYNDDYHDLPSRVHDAVPPRHASHITTTPRSNDVARSEHDDYVILILINKIMLNSEFIIMKLCLRENKFGT